MATIVESVAVAEAVESVALVVESSALVTSETTDVKTPPSPPSVDEDVTVGSSVMAASLVVVAVTLTSVAEATSLAVEAVLEASVVESVSLAALPVALTVVSVVLIESVAVVVASVVSLAAVDVVVVESVDPKVRLSVGSAINWEVVPTSSTVLLESLVEAVEAVETALSLLVDTEESEVVAVVSTSEDAVDSEVEAVAVDEATVIVDGLVVEEESDAADEVRSPVRLLKN